MRIAMNVRPRIALGLLTLSLLVACADPNKRALVLQSPDGPVEKITVLDVVLEQRGSFGDPKAREALNSQGWDSGVFARNFVTELSTRFAERGIGVAAVHSKWGPVQQLSGNTSPPERAIYSMVIHVDGVQYGIRTFGGVPTDTVMHGFILGVKTTLLRNGKEIWAAREAVNVAPIDRTGASRFSTGILNALADSKFVAAK